ncbi:hypothetical protein LEP1GSC125_0548 [Leptospira mayottensis 200901122]|uniref:Uncharacterized protein n=1 Tax=Leptospira mayottensis 200901122 TaxID=1193010 RepID=A0AA87MS16_9LEPT|nr:hypothetical protein LEP1GSC125_0548 [Leptospira mayottensis 200901122]
MVSKHKKHTLKCDFADRKIGEVFLSRKNTGKNAKPYDLRFELNTGV